MVSLGVASSVNGEAGGAEGCGARQTVVVREEGRPPTHFQLGNCIGRGQFGAVYRALNLNTGQMVAVKRISLEGLKEEEVMQLMREVDLVKMLSHPSIVKYEGMARDEGTLSIVLEYAENGSLGQTLKAFGKLNEKLVASYVVKILEGLDYLHRSDVVHCDLKAANILTTKTGNVKLSDFGVSLNLRAVEREIKDVAGTPNWMAPEVIELKGATTKADIWSLGCTVIELLTGRPPYGDIANTMTVMFRIVEDECPPIPDGFSESLVAFLKLCFHKDPAQRPSAEELFEHEWLKNHWGLYKDLRPQDSIPFLRRVSADLQKIDAVRHLTHLASFDYTADAPGAEKDDVLVSGSPGQHSFINDDAAPPLGIPQAEPDLFDMREHTFVKTTFSKPVSCRVCVDHVKKGAVLCSHCSLIAHAKCAARAPPTCDLRSRLLMHAQFAERASPVDLVARIGSGPASSDGGASASRGSLDRERTGSPSHAHPPTAYKVLTPFRKHSRASLTRTPEPARSSSSISLAPAPSPAPLPSPGTARPAPPEGGVLRRKLSILTRQQREPPAPERERERPLSLSSASSSPSPASPQSNSMRSMQTAAESLSSRAARAEASSDAGLAASVYSSASTVPDVRLILRLLLVGCGCA
ncbi:kinase-like domain-containing protein [Gloeopeniophorella convolvens]|nr:kinase-like domain-containing protein [Gloeopeniophorella convolvens]